MQIGSNLSINLHNLSSLCALHKGVVSNGWSKIKVGCSILSSQKCSKIACTIHPHVLYFASILFFSINFSNSFSFFFSTSIPAYFLIASLIVILFHGFLKLIILSLNFIFVLPFIFLQQYS